MIKRNLRLKSHVPQDQAYQAIYKKIETKVSARGAKTIIYSPRSTTCSYLIRSNNSTPRNFSQQQIIPLINKIESPSISFRTETTKIQRKVEVDIFAFVQKYQKKKEFKRNKIFSNIQKLTKFSQNNNYLRNSVLFLNKIRQNIITSRKIQMTDKYKQRLNFDNQEGYQQTNFYVKMYLNDMLIQQITVNSNIIDIPLNKYKSAKKECIFKRREAQHFDCEIEKVHFDDPYKVQYTIASFGLLSYPEFEDVNTESFPEMEQNDDSVFIEDNHGIKHHNKIEQKPIEMLMCFQPYNQKQLPIISYLDDETKNILLSVDYSQTDRVIYESNIFDTIVPDLSYLTDNKYVKKYFTKLINQKYSNILKGTYQDILQLTDVEHDNQQQEEQTQTQKPKLLKQQTKFKLKSQGGRFFSPQHKLTRMDSRISIINNSNIDSNKYQSSFDNTDEIIEISPQIEFKNKIKLSKYQVYNNMVKIGKSKIKTCAMLIEHNMVNELRDFLRQNLNFKLNQQLKDGTPLIIIAARAGYKQIMQLFLDERVDTHQIDQDGKDAYYHAIKCQNYDVADLLVSSGY